MAADEGMAKPGPARTWRPMLLWTAGILLALGLAWFTAAVAVPVWQVDRELSRYLRHCSEDTSVSQLGGPARASAKLTLYLRLNRRRPESIKAHAAVMLLGSCGRHGTPTLIGLLNGRDYSLRVSAARGLGEVGRDAAEAMPHLLRAAVDPQAGELYLQARRSIERMGPAAVPWLLQAIDEPDLRIREQAIQSLGDVGPSLDSDSRQRVISALEAVLRNKDWGFTAGRALSCFSSEAIPVLTRALGDEEPAVRHAAMQAIGLLDNEAKAAVRAIAVALGDKDVDVRRKAAQVLCRLGPAAAPAEPQLTKALADEDETVCAAAAEALRQIRPKGEDTQRRP